MRGRLERFECGFTLREGTRSEVDVVGGSAGASGRGDGAD